MQLKSLEDALNEENTEPVPEDAWLNDVGPTSQLQTKNDHKQVPVLESETAEPSSELETYSLIDYAEFLEQQDTPTQILEAVAPAQTETQIGPSHRLWPLMLRLSEHIWQQLHQRPAEGGVHESSLIEFVHNRSLDALRLDGTVSDLSEVEQLSHGIVEEVLGYGPLEAFMSSEDISEITVINPHLTYIVRNNKLQEIPDCFEDERHMLRIIENMLHCAGQRLEPGRPMTEIRLRDGTSISIAMPPYALHGPTITIRKSSRKLLTFADLIQLGSMTQEMADFLAACVQARLNIVICGGIGSGRTTLLNALGSCIPADQRIVTIEDIAELQLNQKQVVALEARSTNPDNARSATMRDLLLHALRIRPEHLIVGECRGSEVGELLEAMYSGRSGVLTSIFAHNLRDCFTRLKVMCQLGDLHLPSSIIRAQIAGSLDLVVYISRLRDGSHKIINIAEIQGLENDSIRLQNIFHYQETELDTATGMMQGIFKPGGFRPHCMTKLEAANIQLPREMFMAHPH
jgi:pilus assembly protein CpaF